MLISPAMPTPAGHSTIDSHTCGTLSHTFLFDKDFNVPQFIEAPTRIEADGTPPKLIEEFVGRVKSKTEAISIARMQSPPGWSEPGQTPEFTEYTLVLRGVLTVATRQETLRVAAGQAIITFPGEWIRYSTPDAEGAEYVAICLPAFSPETVNRDA